MQPPVSLRVSHLTSWPSLGPPAIQPYRPSKILVRQHLLLRTLKDIKHFQVSTCKSYVSRLFIFIFIHWSLPWASNPQMVLVWDIHGHHSSALRLQQILPVTVSLPATSATNSSAPMQLLASAPEKSLLSTVIQGLEAKFSLTDWEHSHRKHDRSPFAPS